MSLSEGVYKQMEAKNTYNPPKSLEHWEEIGQRDQTILFQMLPSQTTQKHQKIMLSDAFSGNREGNIVKKWVSFPFFLHLC